MAGEVDALRRGEKLLYLEAPWCGNRQASHVRLLNENFFFFTNNEVQNGGFLHALLSEILRVDRNQLQP